MQLPERLRYLLELGSLSPAAAAHALHLLCLFARHSRALATTVVRCPRMLTMLSSRLDAIAQRETLGGEKTGGGEAWRGEAYQHVACLSLAHLLCAAGGRTVARELLDAGHYPPLPFPTPAYTLPTPPLAPRTAP